MDPAPGSSPAVRAQALIDDTWQSHPCAAALHVEVLSTLRHLERLGAASPTRTEQAVADLRMAPITRWPTTPVLDAIWDLRANFSAYDACYVALARTHVCQLVTGDARLARAPGMKTMTILV